MFSSLKFQGIKYLRSTPGRILDAIPSFCQLYRVRVAIYRLTRDTDARLCSGSRETSQCLSKPIPRNQLAPTFYTILISIRRPEKLTKYNRCGTVQDLMVALLCGRSEVAISTQNAASWGYFLTEEGRWETDILTENGFPTNILPKEILKPGEAAGTLDQTWFGIPAGTPVGKLSNRRFKLNSRSLFIILRSCSGRFAMLGICSAEKSNRRCTEYLHLRAAGLRRSVLRPRINEWNW